MSAHNAVVVLRTALITLTVLCVVATVFVIGPWLETRYAPVVSKLHIDRLVYNGPTSTMIYGDFTKLRRCEYIGISWFHGAQDGEFERVPISIIREPTDVSSPDRPVGHQAAGPWIVAIPEDEVRGNSFAELKHYCHPGWVTTTEFYP